MTFADRLRFACGVAATVAISARVLGGCLDLSPVPPYDGGACVDEAGNPCEAGSEGGDDGACTADGPGDDSMDAGGGDDSSEAGGDDSGDAAADAPGDVGAGG